MANHKTLLGRIYVNTVFLVLLKKIKLIYLQDVVIVHYTCPKTNNIPHEPLSTCLALTHPGVGDGDREGKKGDVQTHSIT